MAIREYRAQDRMACIAIFESNTPTFFATHELAEFKGWLDKIEQTPKSTILECYYYVLEEAGTLMACGGFHLDTEHATLAWGMVDHLRHRQGYGEHLLSFRLQTIRSLCPTATVTLDTTQHSYPFFEKMGFRVTAITQDYYSAGLDRYDMSY